MEGRERQNIVCQQPGVEKWEGNISLSHAKLHSSIRNGISICYLSLLYCSFHAVIPFKSIHMSFIALTLWRHPSRQWSSVFPLAQLTDSNQFLVSSKKGRCLSQNEPFHGTLLVNVLLLKQSNNALKRPANSAVTLAPSLSFPRSTNVNKAEATEWLRTWKVEQTNFYM